MLRRDFFATFLKLAGLAGLAALPHRAAASRTPAIPLQTSPVAGFQYHAGEHLWPRLCVGAPLALVREPENRYDSRAVRVDWEGHKLGYVPAIDNAAIAQLLDRGQRLEARIAALNRSRNPWKRVAVEIRLITERA